MTYWSSSASPGASLITLCPLPMCQVPHFSSAWGMSSLPSGPQSYIVGTCGLDVPVRSLWPYPVFGPTIFCPGWAPWMSHGPHAPFAVSGSGPTLISSLHFLRSSQPSLLPGTVRRLESKELECICCQNYFSMC